MGLSVIDGPVVTHRHQKGHVEVQVQLDAHGNRAADVADWLEESYGHLAGACHGSPHLSVTVNVPHERPIPDSWYERIGFGLAPIELAFEILAECFTDLGLEPCTVRSVHLTC